tara:strand:- start:53 stop:1117 length:1065 start_codon:yes stop_codon:yes gene_type:complete
MAYTTIDDPSIYFNTLAYAGNGSSGRSVTGVGFQPDWVWIKNRSDGDPNKIFDSVRGVSKSIKSNSTDAEVSTEENGYVSAFNSDGFTLTQGSSSQQDVNKSSENYVAWNWLAGGSASSNSSGDITSSVSASTTAGISIVSYTGTGATATIGHGLGAAPKMVIVKQTNTTRNWVVMHQGIGFTKYLYLDSTQASSTGNFFNDTDPSSTVFNVVNDGGVNASSGSYIAYCFAPIKGYSKFGNYTGNGNADGTFVHTGFSPAFVLLKNVDEVEQWWIFDNKRNAYDGNFRYYSLNPNASSAEGTTSGDNNHIDFYSNGFKLRTTAQQLNGTSDNFIYMAFAEAPFVTSTSVPATAR